MASEITVGDWKEDGVKRTEGEPDRQPPRRWSSVSKTDQISAEVSDQDHPASRVGNDHANNNNNNNNTSTNNRGARRFPRMGLDALLHESRPSSGELDRNGTVQFYKVYKRRWFGVVQLTLLNIIVSWDWLTFSPVASTAAQFFDTSESNINWLSTAFLFAFCAVVPVVIYVLHWGPKPSILASAVLILVGNWVRYAGVMASPHSFGAVMFGQILIGFAQPFVLAAPTRYSDMWFTNRGRVAATALMSLANPLGAALGQLIVPFWVYSPADIPNATLYVSIIATIGCVPALFIPARPPTPAAPSSEERKLSLAVSVRVLARSPEFWMLFVPYAVYVGFFNSISSLLNQVMQPYGFDDTESGLAGAVLIVVGLASSAVTSPILDRTKAFLRAIKLAVPAIGLCYLALVWMPATRTLAGPYVVLAALGAASFSLVPVAMELLAELTHPVSPAVTATLAWAGGQLLGGVFIIASDALRAGPRATPPRNMDRALVFEAVVAMAVVPVPLCLGLFGRRDHVLLRRVQTDRDRLAVQGAAAAAQAGRDEDGGAA